jgi:hypothetical protein
MKLSGRGKGERERELRKEQGLPWRGRQQEKVSEEREGL